MTKLQEAVLLLKTLKQDAKLALSDNWDRSDEGFRDQIILIDRFLSSLERGKRSKFVQLKIWNEELKP